jgi:hypothetical protein
VISRSQCNRISYIRQAASAPVRTAARVLAGLWARIIQQILALNACIWHNRMIGALVKRSLIAYDH